MANPDPRQLVKVLSQHYGTSDLKEMCYELGVEYEDLNGQNKSSKVRELVQYMERRGRLDEIVAYVQKTRPQVNLAGGDAAPASTQAQTTEQPASVTNNFYGPVNQGNSTTVGNISDSSGIAVGEGASASVESTNNSTTNTNTGTMVGSVMGSGKVKADNIAGRDVNIGTVPQTKEEFAQQLEELKQLLAQAVSDSDLTAVDADTAVSDLHDAVEEATKETPNAKRITRRLEDVSDVIHAVGNAGAAILKATPVIAGLLKAASILF